MRTLESKHCHLLAKPPLEKYIFGRGFVLCTQKISAIIVAIGFLANADWLKSLEDLEPRSAECLSSARPRESLALSRFSDLCKSSKEMPETRREILKKKM